MNRGCPDLIRALIAGVWQARPVGTKFPYKAKERVVALIHTLETMTKRDPEQEVQGIAVPVLDAALEDIKAALPGDPVVAAIAGIVSPEMIEAGEPIRAVDALLVAEQLNAAIGHAPIHIA